MICSTTRFLYLYQLFFVFIVLFPSVILWRQLLSVCCETENITKHDSILQVNSFITLGLTCSEEKMQSKLLVESEYCFEIFDNSFGVKKTGRCDRVHILTEIGFAEYPVLLNENGKQSVLQYFYIFVAWSWITFPALLWIVQRCL